MVLGQAPSSKKRQEVEDMSISREKSNQVAEVKQLILGTQKHYGTGGSTLQVSGATFTVTALTQLMQDFVDNRSAVETAQAAARAKIETERAQAPSQLAVIRGLVTIVKATFGTSADALADFGLALPKARTPLTAEQKAVAVAKRAATRTARHTMGKNQKQGVRGAVTARLVVTPQAGSEPTVTTPAPVATAPAGGTTPHAS
jgi:hypothetical protein